MAYSLQVDDVIEVVIQGEADGQTTITTFHYMMNDPATDAVEWLQAALNTFQGEIDGTYARFRNVTGDDFIFRAVTIQRISPTRNAKIGIPIGEQTGLVNSECLPPANAVAVTRRTELAGRHQHGSLHMPGVPLSFVANGILTANAVSTYSTFANSLTFPLEWGNATARPVIFNRLDPLASTTVSNAAPMTSVRTMRRRVVGRGI